MILRRWVTEMPPSLRHNLDQLTCAVAWTTHAQASAVLWLRSSPLLGSHLDVLPASRRCAPSGLILDHGQLRPDHRPSMFGARRILGVAQQRAHSDWTLGAHHIRTTGD